jgi:DNA-binding MarR family transcriptional regulator
VVSTQEPAAIADELLDAIAALRRQLRRAAGRPWPDDNLTYAQSELLRLVRRRPGLAVAEAADELGLAANTVSTLVGQLTGMSLLRRTKDDADRRVARLTLTEPAHKRVTSWRDRRSGLVAEALRNLTPADLTTLTRAGGALGRLGDQLRDAEVIDGPGN